MPGIPPNLLFSVLAFIGFLLTGVPLPWHIHSWNTGSSMYMLWTGLGCLILFINSIVWNDNVRDSAPVWCDISARYITGASVGIPASSLCIIRRLYYMTGLQTISIEKARRRREIIVDVSIGIGLPCVVMALQYVVQSRRFAIYEQVGCYPFTDNTPLAYFLVFMWPLVIGLISLVYAVLTLRRAFLQKEKLKKMLHAGFFISAGLYWRLMALCSVAIAFTVPLSLYVIISNAVGSQLVPYVSWASVHLVFSQIPQYPAAIWQAVPSTAIGLESTRWLYILCAFVIFAFFGWVREARKFYCQVFWSVCRRLGYSKPPSPSLPIAASKEKRRFTYAGKHTFVHGVDQQLRSKHLSMPVQARAKHDTLRTLPSFRALSRSESLSSSLGRSVDEGSTETLPRLPTPSGSACHMHISWPRMPAVPEPAAQAKDRRSLDVGQLI